MYPLIELNCKTIRKNAEILLRVCREHNIEPYAVIKGFNADPAVTSSIVDAGFPVVASSRLEHLAAFKQNDGRAETLALRIPMLSETEEVVKYADISLNSQKRTLEALNAAACKAGKIHKVILMRDLGDLREGVISGSELVELAQYVENKLKSLRLHGIGTNLGCYGSVLPTKSNLTLLAEDAEVIEQRIGRPLDVVSGGATSSIPLMLDKGMPAKINNLRIGTSLIFPGWLKEHYGVNIEGLSDDGFIFSAEIIEIGEKPTHPIGTLDVDYSGSHPAYENKGIRRRALLAAGSFDFGNCEKLTPIDPGIRILGASSDHMIVDIEGSRKYYALGNIISFRMRYPAILFSTANSSVSKVYK